MSINEKINAAYARKTPLTDKSMIKGKDLDILRQITKYLDEHSLTYTVRCSTQENAQKGLIKNYSYIDILVKKSDSKDRYDAIMDLYKASENFSGFEHPEFMSAIVKTNITNLCVGSPAAHQFIFQRDEPKTKIYLNFEDNRAYKRILHSLVSYFK